MVVGWLVSWLVGDSARCWMDTVDCEAPRLSIPACRGLYSAVVLSIQCHLRFYKYLSNPAFDPTSNKSYKTKFPINQPLRNATRSGQFLIRDSYTAPEMADGF